MASQTNAISRLGVEPIGKLLLSYSLPSVVSMAVLSTYNILSSVFIGHGAGAYAITGLAVTYPFLNLIVALGMLTAQGGATVCSISLGAKKQEHAALVLGNSVVLALFFSVLFAIVSLVFLDPILRLFGASADTLPYAREYMEILLWGTPVTVLMMTFVHLMRASGYPIRSMLILVFSVLVNTILTALFIFTFDWGIRGAAIATILSQMAAVVFLLAHFRNKNHPVHFAPGIFTLRAEVAKPILAIGLSPFLMNASACLIVMVTNLSVREYGGDLAIGAYGIIGRLLMLFIMVVIGLTQGMQPIIGYNFGARRMDRVNRTLLYGIIAATLITSSGFIGGQFFSEALARMFTTHEDLISLSARGLSLSAAMFFIVGGQIVIASYFQFMGRASIAIFLSLARQLLFLLPGLIILPRFFGLDGVWISLPIADVVSAILCVVMLRHFYRVAGEGATSPAHPPQ
jgi:putative MATE family efflux protein